MRLLLIQIVCPMPYSIENERTLVNPIDNDHDKVTPNRRSYSPATLFATLILVAQVLISIGTYPFLPDTIASHFDAAGHVNGTSPKWVIAVLFPAISIGIYVLVRVLMAASPRLGYQNQRRANQEVVNVILVGVLLLELIIQLIIIGLALGMRIDIAFVVSLAVSLLFIFIGNYLGRLRRNFWAGIRTPWTLASDTVWERTHRLGGWLFVVGGFLGVIMSFVPLLRPWGFLALILLIVMVLFVYSYIEYSRLTVDGREPLSSPFEGGDRA